MPGHYVSYCLLPRPEWPGTTTCGLESSGFGAFFKLLAKMVKLRIEHPTTAARLAERAYRAVPMGVGSV
jgi:hypothetical protein